MTIRSKLLLLLLTPLTAFIIVAGLFYYFNWSREFLFMGSCFTLLLVIATVFLIADLISKPVRQLNHAALQIAAGNYETNIQVDGPKEIVELAQTFNTMSECLVEHISRLKESSIIRERMYGEYECSLLLQHYMLNQVIDDFRNPNFSICMISTTNAPLQKGLSLRIRTIFPDHLALTLIEAREQGFFGLYQLNQCTYMPIDELKNNSFIDCHFIDQYRSLNFDTHALFPPLVWSMHTTQFIKASSTTMAQDANDQGKIKLKLNDLPKEDADKAMKSQSEKSANKQLFNEKIPLQNGDMIFLYNSSFIEYFLNEHAIEQWFAKVLRHFAKEGLKSIQPMLTNELSFLAKKQQTKLNFKIISLQLHLE